VSTRLRHGLSKRERQMMEAIYRRREATAAEVRGAIPDPPGYSAVRATLEILVGKGFLGHRRVGRRYVYTPTIPHGKARRSALQGLLATWFDGSVTAAVAALVDVERSRFSEADYRTLMSLIEKSERTYRHDAGSLARAGERHARRGPGAGPRRVRRGASGGAGVTAPPG
jgi:predicted transcriptional regulator